MIEAQHVLLSIVRLVSRVIDFFVVEDVFKKEKRIIVFFFKCEVEEGIETENLIKYSIRNGPKRSPLVIKAYTNH